MFKAIGQKLLNRILLQIHVCNSHSKKERFWIFREIEIWENVSFFVKYYPNVILSVLITCPSTTRCWSDARKKIEQKYRKVLFHEIHYRYLNNSANYSKHRKTSYRKLAHLGARQLYQCQNGIFALA